MTRVQIRSNRWGWTGVVLILIVCLPGSPRYSHSDEKQTESPAALAVRSFSTNHYAPGESVQVDIRILIRRNPASSLSVIEQIPEQWRIDQISHGGVSQNGTLIWTIRDYTTPLTLRYTVFPPPEQTNVAVFHGVVDAHPITGDGYLPPPIKFIRTQPSGHWRYWTTADGLRETCGLCQVGNDGKIWIRHGAVNQMSCLDGYTVRKIPSPGVWRQIFEGRSNQLWSFDLRGLLLFREGTWISYPITDSDFSYVKILPTYEDQVFLCFPDRLIEFNAKQRSMSIVKCATDTELGRFINITPAKDGDILIAGKKGVARLILKNRSSSAGATWVDYPFPPEFGVSDLDFLIEDETSRLYGSAQSENLNLRVLLHFDKMAWHLKFMADQNILAGWPGVDNGFWLWKSSAFYPFLDYLTIQHNEIYETNVQLPSLTSIQLPILESGSPVAFESAHSFWISLSPGIARYAPAAWRTPEPLADLNEHINAQCEDVYGRLWFTTFNKLLLLQNWDWKSYSLPPGFSTYQWEPYGVAMLRNGKLAIRTMNAVLLLFDPEQETFQTIEHPEGRRISLIFPRKDGTLWIQAEDATSTRQHFVYRLEIYDGETFTVAEDHEDRWNIEQLRYIYEDGQGIVWLGGMAEEKVGLLQNGEYHTLREYPGDSAMCIFPYDEKRIWVSDRNAIYEFDGNQWSTVRSDLDGVPSIIRSRDGSIWIATWNGLYHYINHSWIQHSREEGLSSFCIFKVFEDSQSRIWAATARGLNLYHPEADSDPPKVFIDSEVNADAIAPGAVAKFVFSGIDKWKYTPQNRLLFSHRVDNDPWSPYTESTIANYPNLTPGAHRFAVKAMDRNRNESPSPALFQFTVLRHWFEEPLFLTLLISGSLITLTAVGYAISRHINLEKLVAKRTIDLQDAHQKLLLYQQQLQSFASEMSLIEERDRRQIAEELHDRIGHGLAACQMQIETIRTGILDANMMRSLDQALEMLEQTIQEARTLTFEISPPVLYELGLESAIEWLIEEMEKQHGMQIDLLDDGRHKAISEDARGVLFRAVRELLFNVLKHAGTFHAKVSICQESDRVRLCVEDDGVGFDFQERRSSIPKRHSFGLFSIRERIEYLGGSFACESASGKGTRVVLTMPCGAPMFPHVF
ncbi:MAG: hypothetical protein C4527_24485 [Candidatus Omnitrophota bacterium]|jgi:signal transduction histidine kinase|nr:MAG: hypothetical protein C4527_24485 [Candidatus Omnitrophota bacterium]